MKKILQDRKTLYLVLAIVMVSVFTLSIAYAAMSAVLEIHGNSEVVASSWDIHLENAQVKSGSVATNAPVILGNSSLTFDVELNMPGDFYEFTVDVVNEGSIDAMIDSVVKTPELTTEQAKYIKYEITYENGESISSKQTLKKGTFTPIKVRVEYRKDIVAGDLPSSTTELSLKLTLVYVQSDGTGTTIKDNGEFKLLNIVNGDGTKTSDEICVGSECFYVMYSDDTSVTMLAKHNLYIGGEYNSSWVKYGEEATGLQDSTMIGGGITPRKGTISFSDQYWEDLEVAYPTYIYDSRSALYEHIENYKEYLNSLGIIVSEARPISYDELIDLGCVRSNLSCKDAPKWVYSTSYWTGSAANRFSAWNVSSTGIFDYGVPYNNEFFGCRPVVTISRDYLQ